MAYMMTCGHNSDSKDTCPYECPDSVALFRVSDGKLNPELEKEQEEESE